MSRYRPATGSPSIATFDPKQYDRLFVEELEKVIAKTSDPTHRETLERLRELNWMSYIAASVRAAGFRDQREVQERAHDIAARLLTGTLFRGFDERTSGPMDLRFKATVGNAIRNMVAKDRNRRRLLPTTSIGQEVEPGRSSRTDEDDENVVKDFRRLAQKGLAILP